MKISLRIWAVFGVLALIGCAAWMKIMYPQYRLLDLKVDRSQALSAAENYLRSTGEDPGKFMSTVVFNSDDWADRYLQKTIGPLGEDLFITQQGYELFSWNIRFFKPLQKEEYYVAVSPATGKLTEFEHLIEDTAYLPSISLDEARRKSEELLAQKFALDLRDYDFHEEKAKRYEKRTDYNFSWEKKLVYIPWGQDGGGAKLLAGTKVSGDRVSAFTSCLLDIPEKFRRYCQKEQALGVSLYYFNVAALMALTALSAFLAFRMRSFLVIRVCLRWYIVLAVLVIILRLLYLINAIPEMLFEYPTSVGFTSFITTYALNSIIMLLFFGLMFVMPGLAGESLRQGHFPRSPQMSFGHYLLSSFFTRAVAASIIFGYLIFCITVGLQAILLHLGQSYLGVWKEWSRITQFSSAYLPILSIFALGVSASFSEEVTYRLFGITAAIRYFKNPLLAILLSSLVWGLGHSTYPIFPVWYRIIEVGAIGVFYGCIFLRLGIIPLIVGHYLVDVFWGAMAYLFGHVGSGLFWGSISLLLLPAAMAVLAYATNKKDEERATLELLDKTQAYNLGVLMEFVAARKSQGKTAQEIKDGLLAHSWDAELVDQAIKKVFSA